MACLVKPGAIEGRFGLVPDAVMSHMSSFLSGHGICRVAQLSRGFHQKRACFFANQIDLISSLLIRRRHDLTLLTPPEMRALNEYGASVRELRLIDHEGCKIAISDALATLIVANFPGLLQLACKVESESTLRILRPVLERVTLLDLECEVSISQLKQCVKLKTLELQRAPITSVLNVSHQTADVRVLKLTKCTNVECGVIERIAKKLQGLVSIQVDSCQDPNLLQGVLAFPHLESADVTIDREHIVGAFFQRIKQHPTLRHIALTLLNRVDSKGLLQLHEASLTRLKIGFADDVTPDEICAFFLKQTQLQTLTILTATPQQLQALSACRALRSLTFGSQVSFQENTEVQWLSALKTLEEAQFRYTGTIGISIFQALQALPRLRSLVFCTVGLPKEGWDAVGKMSQLKHLELSYVQRESEIISRILELSSLETLSISGAFIDDALLQKLATLQTLRTLKIGFSTHSPGFVVTAKGLMQLAQLQALNELLFERLYWIEGHEDVVKNLRLQLPNTRVIELI